MISKGHTAFGCGGFVVHADGRVWYKSRGANAGEVLLLDAHTNEPCTLYAYIGADMPSPFTVQLVYAKGSDQEEGIADLEWYQWKPEDLPQTLLRDSGSEYQRALVRSAGTILAPHRKPRSSDLRKQPAHLVWLRTDAPPCSESA